MKYAIHIASGKIVSVEQSDYKDYFGIFLCPTCRKTVHLRKNYIRFDGIEVRSAFVHPEAEKYDLCPDRVDSYISESMLTNYEPISRGQNFELLQAYFIWILDLIVYTKRPIILPGTKPLTFSSITQDNNYVVWVFHNQLSNINIKLFSKAVYNRTTGVLCNIFNEVMTNMWDKPKLDSLLSISAKLLQMYLKSVDLDEIVNLQDFLKKQNQWKGLLHKSQETNEELEKLIEIHCFRVSCIFDFMISTDDLTRKITIGLAWIEFQKLYKKNKRIIDWLDNRCTPQFFKAAELLLDNPKNCNNLFKQIQEKKITPRLEKMAYLFELTIKPIEQFIKYKDWELALKSLVDFIESN